MSLRALVLIYVGGAAGFSLGLLGMSFLQRQIEETERRLMACLPHREVSR